MKNKILFFFFFGLISVCGIAQTSPGATDSSSVKNDKRIITDCFGWNDEPQFNGPLGFHEYLRANIKYPKTEKENNIAGTVYISFVVEADGSVTNVKELKGVAGGPGLTTEVIRVIGAMPQWKPRLEDGKPVPTEMKYPVRFVLEEKAVPTDTVVHTYCEVMPHFPGGNDSMHLFIRKNLRYSPPGSCKQGTVYISFVVEQDGSISDIKSLKEVPGAPEFTKEAIRVVSLFPKFSPGQMNGKSVRCKYHLPVRFI
ncbi:MAG: energy transducer TonB [Bacteroidota bacterium]|nr:energy transducer TonB [Bacteroidota bacterium]